MKLITILILLVFSVQVSSYDDGQLETLKETGNCFYYEDYVRSFPDLLMAYDATDGSESIEDWGRSHYERLGKIYIFLTPQTSTIFWSLDNNRTQ